MELKDICSINMGQSPESSSYNEKQQGIPFFQGNADFGMLNPKIRIWCDKPTKIANEGDILLSVRAPIGAMNIADRKCCIGRGLAAITANKELCNVDYLWYALKNKVPELQSKGTGSTFKAINKQSLQEIELNVPSLIQQKQIADKLNKLTDLIDKRKKQLEKLDELVKARFVEMFGDPMYNSRNYKMSTYGELFGLNAGGTPSKQKREYWDNGNISWIGSNMCQDAIIYENDGKYITQAGYDNSSAKLFPVDTVLIALVGATIGKTALLKFETTTNQNVLGVRGIKESNNNPYFVFYYTQGLHKKFMDIGDGGFNMASKDFVSKLPFPIVEIEYQNQFANFVSRVNKSKVVVQKALDEAQLLFGSLMQKYFG